MELKFTEVVDGSVREALHNWMEAIEAAKESAQVEPEGWREFICTICEDGIPDRVATHIKTEDGNMSFRFEDGSEVTFLNARCIANSYTNDGNPRPQTCVTFDFDKF
jgi:hypothetical protein